MDWIEKTKKAIRFIEDNLDDNLLSPKMIAQYIYVSESHFTRAFRVLTGLTISEYVRNRRLFEASNMLKESNISVLDVALNVGYESPEAFSKAFKRFYGIRPIECKNETVKPFYPLQIKLILTQEQPVKWYIEDKKEIYLCGTTNVVSNDDLNATAYLWAQCETMGFLDKCYAFSGFETIVGVSTSEGYTIKAKCTNPIDNDTITIPPHKWAVFPCSGEGPHPIIQTWDQIYSSWIPKTEYEISDYPQLEVYSNSDSGYTCEIWVAIE